MELQALVPFERTTGELVVKSLETQSIDRDGSAAISGPRLLPQLIRLTTSADQQNEHLARLRGLIAQALFVVAQTALRDSTSATCLERRVLAFHGYFSQGSRIGLRCSKFRPLLSISNHFILFLLLILYRMGT